MNKRAIGRPLKIEYLWVPLTGCCLVKIEPDLGPLRQRMCRRLKFSYLSIYRCVEGYYPIGHPFASALICLPLL